MTNDPGNLDIPRIAALPGPQPRWSVMIPTFNCADMAGETIASVIVQAPLPDEMEIVVVDDASSDGIADVVARFGGRVRLHRQRHNLGVPTNLTEAIRLSRGQIVHLLHGDDQVLPGFYAAMERAFTNPAIGAAYCRQIFMNQHGDWLGISPLDQEDGLIPDAARFLAQEQRIMTPSICVRRRVYEEVGGFHPLLRCAEDWEMWVRIAARYPIAHLRAPLAVYRTHDASNTGRNIRCAADVAYNGLAIELIAKHLPPGIADAVASQARRTYARSALATADRFTRAGDAQAAFAQLFAAFRLSTAPTVVFRAALTLLRIARCAIFRSSAGSRT